jgi:uncharacterized protein YeaO (DUF488 family)
MPIRVVQLGNPRMPSEGLRLGTVRRPPRGVPKKDYAKRDFFDVWLPDLAPSADLMQWLRSETITEARMRLFSRRYRSEMKAPERSRLLDVLAALSNQTDFSIGCYCENETQCHRSILKELLGEHGAKFI